MMMTLEKMTTEKLARKTSNMFSYFAITIFILVSAHTCTGLLYGKRISASFTDYCQEVHIWRQFYLIQSGMFYECGEPAGLCICKDHTAFCNVLSQALPVLPDDISILNMCNDYFFGGTTFSELDTILLSPRFLGNLTNVTELHIHEVVDVMPATFDLLPNLTKFSIKCGGIQPSPLRTMMVNYLSIPTLRSLTLLSCCCNIALPSFNYYGRLQSQLRSLSVIACRPPTENNILDLSVISSLQDLQRISFTGCGISQFVPTELPALEELILDTNYLKWFPQTCKSDMDNSSFFPSLKRISLKRNLILWIGGPGNTTCLPQVTEIDVSENIIYGIQNGVFDAQSCPKLENITYSLPIGIHLAETLTIVTEDFVFANPSIKFLNLTNAHWRFAGCTQDNCVNQDTFANSSLTHLILDGNDFDNVPPDLFLVMFGNLRNLVHLSIRNCRLAIPMNVFICMLNLDYLAVSTNSGSDCTHGYVPYSIQAFLSLKQPLDIGEQCNNAIKIYKADNIAMMPNRLDYYSPSSTCNKLYNIYMLKVTALVSSALTQFSFRYNGIDFGNMLCIDYVETKDENTVHQSNYRIHFCVPSVFKNKPNLTVLQLDGNDFSTVDTKQFVLLFGKLTNLEHFSLSECNIQYVSVEMFRNYPHLQYLDLSSNKLTTLSNMPFVVFPMLTTLYLHANALSVVPGELLSPDQMKRMRTFTLYENPLECSCGNRWLQSWLVSRPEVFDYILRYVDFEMPSFGDSFFFSKEHYSCANDPSRSVANYTMPDQACMIGKEASIAIIITSTVVITILTLFTLLFRYRWHFNLFLYYALSGRGKHKRRRGNYVFDVFVSYDQRDHPWIRQHLMPMLEERQGLQLCIHERDFIPGRYIVTNIAQAVEHSKKILMVFSRNFVVSQWCQFEMDFCLSHVIQNRESLLIVCLDDVTSDEAALTGAMKAALTTMTYIQWVDQPDAIHFFWERIRQSLREVRPRRRHRQPQQERDDQAIIQHIELARWDV